MNTIETSAPGSVRMSLAIGLPMAFASGLAVAGLLLLAILEFGLGEKLAVMESDYGELFSSFLSPEAESAALESPTADAAGDRAGENVLAAAAGAYLPLSVQNDIEFLHDELDAARAERERLLDEVASLTQQLEQFAASSNPAERGGDDQANAGSQSGDAAPVGNVAGGVGEPPAAPLSEFESLVAAGVDAVTADALQQRTDQFALKRLELYDQASREGWLGSDQFSAQLDALESDRVDHRTELGDSGFDRYLFESGRDNRVNVASVIGGSAADLAGVQSGDLIRSYGGLQIFTLPELQSATREGIRGEPIQVTVERDGDVLVVDVPRGPLGVTLNGARIPPSGA